MLFECSSALSAAALYVTKNLANTLKAGGLTANPKGKDEASILKQGFMAVSP